MYTLSVGGAVCWLCEVQTLQAVLPSQSALQRLLQKHRHRTVLLAGHRQVIHHIMNDTFKKVWWATLAARVVLTFFGEYQDAYS